MRLLGEGRWGDSFYVCKSKSKCDVSDQLRTGLPLGVVDVPSPSSQGSVQTDNNPKVTCTSQASQSPKEPASSNAALHKGTPFSIQAQDATTCYHGSLSSVLQRTKFIRYIIMKHL